MRWKISIEGSDEITRGHRLEFEIEKNLDDQAAGSLCLPTPPGIFVLDDGMGLVAKRLEHIPNSDPPAVRVISDNKLYPEYERTAEEIRIIGRIRWFAREI
jgi:hypothetical protein